MRLDNNNLPKILEIPSTRINDLTGKVFERLTVIGYIGNNDKHRSVWLCKCSCNENVYIDVVGTELTKGSTKSCGCFSIENTIKRSVKHNLSNTRIYSIWGGMKDRCYNTMSKDYNKYGGRGIEICKEWKVDVVNFYKWSLQNGYSNDLTIDRINVDGNYEPSNCRWADISTQNKNKTTSIKVEYNNKIYLLTELYSILHPHISYGTFKQRIVDFKWSIDHAINIRPRESKQKYEFIKNIKCEIIGNTLLNLGKYGFAYKYQITKQSFRHYINKDYIIKLLNDHNYSYSYSRGFYKIE